MPSVTIKFFGPAKDWAGIDAADWDIAPGDTVGQIAGRLAESFPSLGTASGLRLAVNRAYVALDHVLKDGDEIAVIPPVSGGTPNPRVFLTREVIDVEKLIATLRRNDAGAITTFAGTVRAETDGDRTLVALEYDAYDAMAAEQLDSTRQRAMKTFAILDAVLVHRLGRLELGEISILVAVAAAHRPDAFDACRWIVETVKADAPIWKKNIWTDGQTDWVDPTCS